MQMHRLLFTIRELTRKLSWHQIYTDSPPSVQLSEWNWFQPDKYLFGVYGGRYRRFA